jgi:hypothetical protein
LSFTDQQPRIATEKDCTGNWSGGKNGKYFRCGLCGYRFKVGDYWRWIYAGSICHTNFLVCEPCDGSNVLEKRKEQYGEYQQLKEGRMWDFLEDWDG